MDAVLPRVCEVLQTTPSRWIELTRILAPSLLQLPPADGEWSAADCLQHLVDTEREVFRLRVRAFLAGEGFPAFDPDSEGNQPSASPEPVELARIFQELRRASLAELDGVSEPDLERRARHAELGNVSLSELLHEWAAHDLMHTVQGERALMQPFIAGCGPWQPYFADHVADKS